MAHIIEFWAHPIWDRRKIAAQFGEIYERMRVQHPSTRIHISLETGDRYRELRSRIAKRASKKRKK